MSELMPRWVRVRNCGIVHQPMYDEIPWGPDGQGAVHDVSSKGSEPGPCLWLPQDNARSTFELREMQVDHRQLGFRRR